MKKMIATIALCACSFLMVQAQESVANDSVQNSNEVLGVDSTNIVADLQSTVVVPPAPQFGYISYQDVLVNMMEYKDAMRKMEELRTRYEVEARYNETNFKRLFANGTCGTENWYFFHIILTCFMQKFQR